MRMTEVFPAAQFRPMDCLDITLKVLCHICKRGLTPVFGSPLHALSTIVNGKICALRSPWVQMASNPLTMAWPNFG